MPQDAVLRGLAGAHPVLQLDSPTMHWRFSGVRACSLPSKTAYSVENGTLARWGAAGCPNILS